MRWRYRHPADRPAFKNPAHLAGEGIERNDLGPGAAPALADGRVFLAPGALLEGSQCGFAGVGVDRPINLLERRGDGLAVFPGDEIEAVAQQVNDASLNRCVRETAVIASGKPLRPSTTAIRTSSTPRFFSSFMTLSQNFAPSVCSIQMPNTSFSPPVVIPSAR